MSNSILRDQTAESVRSLATRLRSHMALYGYLPADAPMLERAELFLSRAGDQILHRLFTFERYGIQLALRPEFTTPALHRYMQELGEGHVARWQFSGTIFEDDPASSQIDYERLSIGAELIGLGADAESRLGADAEIIAMAVNGAAAAGAQDLRLVIGDVQLTRQLIDSFGLDPRTQSFLLRHIEPLGDPALGKTYVLDQYDAFLIADGALANSGDMPDPSNSGQIQEILNTLLDATERGVTMGGRSQQDISRRLLRKYRHAAQRDQIVQVLDVLTDWIYLGGHYPDALAAMHAFAPLAQRGRAHVSTLALLIETLTHYGVSADQIEIQPGLVRDWDYYTGVVFELYAGDALHIAGGGRYDELARLIGAQHEVPAVGFVYYVDALRRALSGADDANTPVFTLCSAQIDTPVVVHWAQSLREHGIAVRLLPSNSVDAAGCDLTLTTDDALRYDGTNYAPGKIAALVEALKRASQ
ncbi:MAG: ATP phosphoribosyltransferase regulatory subunit [Anaerolineae bacterium]|nr:ATP phosphoribosyltransferase regulatory subunit [Anaerolineae bacterium]